jgi:[acyl-carrier-protein] S-malonyltransferase
MGTVAYIFPGQGSQYVGMGKDLAAGFPEAQKMFDTADEILLAPLSKICFEGPEEELKQTKNTQPAIFLHSIILWKLAGPSDASMVAGHSLGEYSALVAAGVLGFEDGLRLVRLRGESMQRAGEEHPGTMAAVLGITPEIIREVCMEASASGIVQPANFNSPAQIVVSGSVAGVRKAMEISKSRGAKLVKELVVSGAFHSPLMASAQEQLTKGLHRVEFRNARIPVYANVTAQHVQDGNEIKQLLLDQLTHPVRWEESVIAMAQNGAGSFIEVGPGKVLQGLVKRCVPSAAVYGIDTAADVNNFCVKN